MLYAFATVTLINFLGFIFCYKKQSDKATDIIYAFSFLAFTLILWFYNNNYFEHHIILLFIALWSLRLGIYLFIRIQKKGKDKRFDSIRISLSRISKFWILQTITVFIILIPVLFFFNNSDPESDITSYLGITIWIFGFIIESIADMQKFIFRNKPENKNLFIQDGLWKFVQHPNYLGEILCWTGIFLICFQINNLITITGIISPLWITFLLTKLSGIPMLKVQSLKKYGHLESYQNYSRKTKLLIPLIY